MARWERGWAAALAMAIAGAAQADEIVAVPLAQKNVTLLGIQSGTVAPGGLAFVALSGATERAGTGSGNDGSLALGFGLGDANKGVGLQFTGYVTSLTDDFADSGYLAVKAGTRLGDQPLYFAVSVDHLAGWGDSSGLDPSFSAALTAFPQVDLGGADFPLMLTLGAGSDIRNNRTDPGVFLGAGIGLTESLGASLAWTGEEMDLGISLRPPENQSLSLTATVGDLFDQEDNRRVTVSVTWVLPRAFGG